MAKPETLENLTTPILKNAAGEMSPYYFAQLFTNCMSLMYNAGEAKNTRVTAQVLRLTMILRRHFDPCLFLRCSLGSYLLQPSSKINCIIMIVLNEFILSENVILQSKKQELITKISNELDVSEPNLVRDYKDVETFLDEFCTIENIRCPKILIDERLVSSKLIASNEASEKEATLSSPAQSRHPAQTLGLDLYVSTFLLMKIIEAGRARSGLVLARLLFVESDKLIQSKKFHDSFLAKIFFYVSWVYYSCGQYHELLQNLMRIYRSALIHHLLTTQAVALNMILKVFIQTSQYEQATKFLKTASFPQDLATNAQLARNLLYLAQIAAVQMNYTVAHGKVTQALRKAPAEGSRCGNGFRLAATKLLVVLHLLLGEIPEKRIFEQKRFKDNLSSYCQIVQAVRAGDLTSFQSLMEKQKTQFCEDGNYILIQRLHHNVIRAGLRKIAATYSCISLDDIAHKLGLDRSDDTESIISKAIADGVVNAYIDSNSGIVYKKLKPELRSWHEIRRILNKKVEACLYLQNDALKAMKYTINKDRIPVEDARHHRELHERIARAELDKLDGGEDGDLI